MRLCNAFCVSFFSSILLGVEAVTVNEVTIGGVCWSYVEVDGGVSIFGGNWYTPAVSISISGDVNIPASIGCKSVVSVGSGAFALCKAMEGVYMPDTVTNVADHSFDGCSKLSDVQLSKKLVSIGNLSFNKCISLENIDFSSGIRSIGANAFSYSGLTCVTLPENLEILGFGAFLECTNLLDVTFSPGLTNISGHVFHGCNKLRKVAIPDTVHEIKEATFLRCYQLSSVVLPNHLTSIGDSAFYACPLQSIAFPKSLVRIGAEAFKGCSLTSLEVPASLTKIGNDAFAENRLASVKFLGGPPDGLQSAGIEVTTSILFNHEYASEWTTIINQCGFSNAKPYYSSGLSDGGPYTEEIGGVVWKFFIKGGSAEITSGLWGVPAIPTNTLGIINVPESLGGCPVTAIGDYAFWECAGLTGVNLLDGINRIGSCAFWECINMRTISLSDTITNIGNYAFYSCSGLRSFNVPKDVTSIGNDVFDSCTNLVSVTLPENVEYIGECAFRSCLSLRTIELPSGVTSIGMNAFSWCDQLSEVIMPEKLVSLGEGAFRECHALKSILIPIGVSVIPPFCFDSCTSLTRINLPDGLVRIENNAFVGCRSLTEISLPETLTFIGSCAFNYCYGLKSVGIPASLYGKVDGVFPYGCELVQITHIKVYGITVAEKYDAKPKCPQWKFDPDVGCSYIGGWEATNCGTYAVVATSSDFNCHTSGIEPRYEILGNSEVNILPRDVMISTASRSKTYDGFSLWDDSVEVTGDGFVEGECLVVAPSSILNVGIETNHVVFEWAESASPANYNIQVNEGTLKITSREIILQSDSATKYYDGLPLSSPVVHAMRDGFVPGECIVTAQVSRTAVGTCKNVITMNWAPDALPSNYSIAKFEGALTVLPANVSSDGSEPWGGDEPRPYVGGEGVQSLYSTMSTYDGMGHTIDIENLAKVQLVGGDTPQITYSLTSNGVYQTDPIFFTNVCSTSIWYRVKSDNHNSYIHEAGIDIMPRTVRLRSGSAVKNYDGTPLTCETVQVLPKENPNDPDEGFAGTDGANYRCWGAQTTIGTSDNPFAYMLYPSVVPKNYDVTEEFGTLTVTATGDVVIAMGVTEIPAGALKNCGEVTSIRMPASVASIGDNAFLGCAGLTNVVFPASMSLRWSELRRMGLTDEFVRSNFTQGDWVIANRSLLAYVGNPDVSELTVPDGIEIIDEEVFSGLYNLERIHFNGSEREIGRYAFRDCTYLDDVEIPDSVEVIGEGSFYGCSFIYDFDMGDGVCTIGARAFEDCQSIEQMICSSHLRDVADRAFANCYYLRDVALPLGVTNVATTAFASCPSLTAVTVPTHVAPLSQWFPEQYKSIRTVSISADETVMIASMFDGCRDLGDDADEGEDSIVLPEGLTAIPDRAFADCESLVRLTLPTGIVSIGEAAFERCAFVAFEMPDAVVTLGAGAFRNCSSLKDVTLARNLTAIPDELFAGCSALDSFTVPGKVTSLGANFVPYQTSAIYFMSNAPTSVTNAYDSANASELVNYVKRGTMGWNGQPTGRVLPVPAVWPKNTSVKITYWKANQFDAVFDANGGYFANPEATTYACKETTFEAYAIPPYDPIRPGFDFLGWWTDPAAGSRIRATTRVTLTKPNDEVQNLYAHWKKAEVKYVTIRFNAMGGTVSPAYTNCIVGGVYGNALTAVVPTKEHYDFNGWYTLAYWPDGELQTAATYVPDADRELFARWDAKQYAVRYHANGGEGDMPDDSFTYGEKFDLSSNRYVKAGCVFVGWALSENGEKQYTDQAQLVDFGSVQDATVELFAVWEEVGFFYAVRFDSNGGIGTMTNQTIAIGETVSLDRNLFTRSGYVFLCWALQTNDYANVYDDCATVSNLSEVPGDTIPLFAVWESTASRSVPAEITGGEPLTVDFSWKEGLDGRFGLGTRKHFTQMYGIDFEAALQMPTGKKDQNGNPMYVWQDYVAGTDPTDEKSRFTSSITVSNGVPVIRWSPNLNENASTRLYRVWGKTSLTNAWEWPADSSVHKFFKVEVAMPDGSMASDAPGGVKARAVVMTDTNIVVTLSSDVQLELKSVPAGSFLMSNADSGTHEVTITRRFWIGTERIMRGAYALFNADYDASNEGTKSATDYVTGRDRAEPFLSWLNEKYGAALPNGYVFRLATEGEWEYAATRTDAVASLTHWDFEGTYDTVEAISSKSYVTTWKFDTSALDYAETEIDPVRKWTTNPAWVCRQYITRRFLLHPDGEASFRIAVGPKLTP